MKAIGNNIIIDKKKEGPVAKTDGGLLLTNAQRQDVRYKEAKVLNCGELVVGVKEGDSIYYDKHAGHRLEVDKDIYYVIKLQDVVVVLWD